MAQALSKDMRHDIEKMAPEFRNALPKHIDVDRFKRVLFTAVQRNPQLTRCDPTSVYAAMMRAAEQGLMPDGRQGALVPLQGKAEFWPMWQGLLDIARLSGCIMDAYPASVRENDAFEYEMGFDRKLVHKPALRDRGDIIMVYCVAILPDGTKTFGPGPMTVDEVETIRAMAPSRNSPAWKNHWEAMAWKTVLKRTLKYVPQSPELADAMEYDNGITIDGEAIQAAPGERSDTPSTQPGDNVQDIRERIEQHQQQTAHHVDEIARGKPIPTDDGGWQIVTHDGTIERWDPEIHSANRSVTKDGHFRKKRGTEKAPAEESPTAPTFEAMLGYIASAATTDDVDALEADARDLEAYTEDELRQIAQACDARKEVLQA